MRVQTECGYSQARAWLHEYNDDEFPINIETISPAYRRERIENPDLVGIPALSAQPNPSIGMVYITYQLPEGIETCEMEIMDSNGQIIEKRMAAGKGLEEWNCKECSSGIYLIRIVTEGIELAVTKVSIVK
jgi:Secretion system C-terminal sorting domain